MIINKDEFDYNHHWFMNDPLSSLSDLVLYNISVSNHPFIQHIFYLFIIINDVLIMICNFIIYNVNDLNFESYFM